MDDLNTYLDRVNEKVSGLVTVRLFKGTAEVVAVETPNTIFDEKLATFMKNNSFNQNASAGFIEIYTLQMRLAQDKERFALVTIGEERNKKQFLPLVQELALLGFKFYATEQTHEFLEAHHVESILLHKMYTKKYPSLEEILRQNLCDLIINVPYDRQTPEAKQDEETIAQWATTHSVSLVSSFTMAAALVEKLKHSAIRKKKS